MTDTPRPRGRPKGTGIDDRDSLRAIVTLLSRDPALKPTTAIRQSGVTDPSVVRRLREKLKATAIAPAGPKRKSAQSPVRPTASISLHRLPSAPEEKSSSSDAKRRRTPAAGSPAQADTYEAPSPAPGTSAETSSAAASAPQAEPQLTTPLADPQLEALRLSAEAAAAVSRLYLHCMNYAAQTNPMSLALRSQTVMNQWIAGLLSGSMPTFSGTEKK